MAAHRPRSSTTDPWSPTSQQKPKAKGGQNTWSTHNARCRFQTVGAGWCAHFTDREGGPQGGWTQLGKQAQDVTRVCHPLTRSEDPLRPATAGIHKAPPHTHTLKGKEAEPTKSPFAWFGKQAPTCSEVWHFFSPSSWSSERLRWGWGLIVKVTRGGTWGNATCVHFHAPSPAPPQVWTNTHTFPLFFLCLSLCPTSPCRHQ